MISVLDLNDNNPTIDDTFSTVEVKNWQTEDFVSKLS